MYHEHPQGLDGNILMSIFAKKSWVLERDGFLLIEGILNLSSILDP